MFKDNFPFISFMVIFLPFFLLPGFFLSVGVICLGCTVSELSSSSELEPNSLRPAVDTVRLFRPLGAAQKTQLCLPY